MFKRIALIAAALVFASGVLITSVMRTSAKSLAQNYKVEPISVTATEEAATDETEGTPAAEKGIEYDLTSGGRIFPGILPDHFLYPLKMIRDRIWLFLTTGPLKKAELLLVFADKRLMASQALIDKGKVDKAVSTATKAEKYLERTIAQEARARSAGKDTNALLEKLSRASLKHEEILLGFKDRVPDQAKGVIDKALVYPRRVYEQVMEVLGRAKVNTTLVLEFSEDNITTYEEVQLERPATVFGILEKVAEDNEIDLVTKQYDFGILVESIGEVENSEERAWIYFVNDEAGEVASDKYELSEGDVVEWRYIEPEF